MLYPKFYNMDIVDWKLNIVVYLKFYIEHWTLWFIAGFILDIKNWTLWCIALRELHSYTLYGAE